MRKAIFLDKDGTLLPNTPFDADPGLIVLEEEVNEGLVDLNARDYLFIIISNQQVVAHGYFSEEDLGAVEPHITQLLLEDCVKLDGFYYCPHFPPAEIRKSGDVFICGKRLPGLLLQAASDFDIDLSQSWMIGDILNDVEAGNRAGCRTVLIDNGNEKEWQMDTECRTPTFIASDMKQAAHFILNAPIASENKSSHSHSACREN